MRKRDARQEEIRRIVRAERIRTQRDLVEHLGEAGFPCTQATVSRDIADMELRKLPEGVYVLSEDMHLQRMVSDLVSDVVRSGDFVIVKVSVGNASGVGAAVDAADLEGILGTIAGDDTILVIMDGEASAQRLVDTLDKYRGKH